MNLTISEINSIFKKFPNVIIEKIYYYYLTPLNNIIQKDIIRYNKNKNININDYSIYSYINYIPITYRF